MRLLPKMDVCILQQLFTLNEQYIHAWHHCKPFATVQRCHVCVHCSFSAIKGRSALISVWQQSIAIQAELIRKMFS